MAKQATQKAAQKPAPKVVPKATAPPKPDEKAPEQPQQKGYHEQSVQQRMARPTPQQQRTAGRGGGEDLASETPVDQKQGSGPNAHPNDEL